MNPEVRGRGRRVGGAGFDPALPEDHSLIVAGVLRDQFQCLQAMIDAVPVVSGAVVDGVTTLPAGSPAEASAVLEAGALHFAFGIPQGMEGREGLPGEAGPQGPPFAQAVVDGVTTLPPGDPATVGVSFDGTDVHFAFGIPQGQTGAEGGSGPPGPPFAQAVVDGVTTLPPGDPATVGVSFDGTNVHFAFGIPQGAKGDPGDVSLEQLSLAIAGTSANSNAVQPLPFNATPNYDPDQFQAVIDKMNELIQALRR
ncbi:MAG: hypothetical protein JNM99_09535 [Verrucomicrobiaceae bacterium]|nr:hypothetical protein [Verrucomicrobiaceae bacterium]